MADRGQGKDNVFVADVQINTLNTANGVVRTDASGKLSSAASLDVDDITLSNIETDNFKANVIDTDTDLTADSDVRLPTQKAIRAFVFKYLAGLAWRPTVQLMDSTQTDAGASIVGQASYNADSVAIVDGDRLLLTAETVAAGTYLNKVFLVSGVGASIVLTLETDGQAGDGDPTDGDVIPVQKGTANGNKIYVYELDSTSWELISSLMGALLASNNLSDVASAATSATNLSLGTGDDVTHKNLTLSEVLKESISAVMDIVAAAGITAIADQTLIIQSSTAGDADISAVSPQIVAGTAGQHLYLIGNDNTKTVTIADGNGLSLNTGQPFTLGDTDTIHLISNGSEWVEVSRSNNG